MHDVTEEPVDIPTLEDEVEFHRQAQEMMQESSPEDEMYFQVVGTTHIVKTEEELKQLQSLGIKMEYVSYRRAVYALQKNAAERQEKEKRRLKNRRAKASRRKNRG